MARKFALVAIQDDQTSEDFGQIIDRYDFSQFETINLKGLGFEFDITTIDTDVESFVTRISQTKKTVQMDIIFREPSAYLKKEQFTRWVMKYMTHKVWLEYNDTNTIKYAQTFIVDFEYGEKSDRAIAATAKLKGLTPFFIYDASEVIIDFSDVGHKYPFTYPFTYGAQTVENNTIENLYIAKIPLTIRIYGSIANPTLTLTDVETNEIYSTIKFDGLNVSEGQFILLDALSGAILLWNGIAYEDITDYIDRNFDLYPYAKAETTSAIGINFTESNTGKLVAQKYQYVL